MKRPCPMRPRMNVGRPIRSCSRSCLARRLWSCWRWLKLVISFTPRARAVCTISSASATVVARGFSHSTCLPYFIASTPISR